MIFELQYFLDTVHMKGERNALSKDLSILRVPPLLAYFECKYSIIQFTLLVYILFASEYHFGPLDMKG